MLIKELADTAGTTVRTVRYYHQEELLPIPRGTPRDYSFDHLVRLIRVRNLVASGLSISQVKKLIGSAQVDAQAELAATKRSIDEQIGALLEQKERLQRLEERHNQAPTAIPLPQRITNFYGLLLEREDDPAMRKVIKREQRMVEVLSHLGFLDSLDYLWSEDPSEEYLDLALRMFRSFRSITELSYEDAEREIDQMMDEHIRLSGFTPEQMPRVFEQFFGTPGGVKLIYLAYPHPNHKLYIRRFLERYVLEQP